MNPAIISFNMENACFVQMDEVPRTTYQSTRKIAYVHGRPLVVDNSKAKKLRKLLAWQMKRFAPLTIEQPCKLEILWLYNAPSSIRKRDFEFVEKYREEMDSLFGEENANIQHFLANQKRPDLDNLAKMLIDTMMELKFFVDDSQIVDLHLQKAYAQPNEKSGILFKITPIINN